jgi:hypothetical protein
MDHLVVDITSRVEDEVIQSRDSKSGIYIKLKKKLLETTNT